MITLCRALTSYSLLTLTSTLLCCFNLRAGPSAKGLSKGYQIALPPEPTHLSFPPLATPARIWFQSAFSLFPRTSHVYVEGCG